MRHTTRRLVFGLATNVIPIGRIMAVELLGPEHAVAGMAFFPGETRGCCALITPDFACTLFREPPIRLHLPDNVIGAKEESSVIIAVGLNNGHNMCTHLTLAMIAFLAQTRPKTTIHGTFRSTVNGIIVFSSLYPSIAITIACRTVPPQNRLEDMGFTDIFDRDRRLTRASINCPVAVSRPFCFDALFCAACQVLELSDSSSARRWEDYSLSRRCPTPPFSRRQGCSAGVFNPFKIQSFFFC